MGTLHLAVEREALRQPRLLATGGIGMRHGGNCRPQHVLEARAHADILGAVGIELRIALVPENVAVLGVEQREPLRNHLERFEQARVGGARLLLGAFGLGAGRIDVGLGPLLLSNVVVSGDPAAPRHRLIDDLDDAAVVRLRQVAGRAAAGDRRHDVGTIFFRIALEGAHRLPVIHEPRSVMSGLATSGERPYMRR